MVNYFRYHAFLENQLTFDTAVFTFKMSLIDCTYYIVEYILAKKLLYSYVKRVIHIVYFIIQYIVTYINFIYFKMYILYIFIVFY